jgi:nicotinate-nucleotide adenylyltransferase
MTRPLAIFGGTFDPVHNAHLRVAWEAAELLDADVRLVPARVPPMRDVPVAPAQHRVAMLQAALAGQSRMSVDDRELHRDGPSFTIDTLLELRDEFGPEQPLVLLVGADAFAGLPQWERWRELFDLAHIGVLTRPGHTREPGPDLRIKIASRRCSEPKALAQSPAGRVLKIPVTALDISATRIRELLLAGAEPRYLVPEALFADPALLAPYRGEMAADVSEGPPIGSPRAHRDAFGWRGPDHRD